ncbi:hypothetical protein ASD80_07945 [Devosia sp. Root635]|nr:hypothetical protein ASD80_07945 [Devosia sp. Root635]
MTAAHEGSADGIRVTRQFGDNVADACSSGSVDDGQNLHLDAGRKQDVSDQTRMNRAAIDHPGGFVGRKMRVACGRGAAISGVSHHRTASYSMVLVRSTAGLQTYRRPPFCRGRFQPVDAGIGIFS